MSAGASPQTHRACNAPHPIAWFKVACLQEKGGKGEGNEKEEREGSWGEGKETACAVLKIH